MILEWNHRLDQISESTTLRLNAIVQEIKARGESVINLTAGEPDFPPPEEAKAAIKQAVDDNKNRYTPVPGIPELRKIIAEVTNVDHPNLSPPWTAKNVIVSSGAKHAIANFLTVILNPDDEVLIPSPYWLSYPEMVKLAGGCPVTIKSEFENGFKITPEQLSNSLTIKTKALFLNSPANPTGAVYTLSEYRALGEVIKKSDNQNFWILSDEIYNRMSYDAKAYSFLEACPDLKDRVATFNGMSKSFAMTGWRVGWCVAQETAIKKCSTLQGQVTSGVNSLAQWASLAALGLKRASIDRHVGNLKRRRGLALEALSKCGKIRLCPPEGAFYVFFGINGLGKKYGSAAAWAEALLEKKRVAVVPGDPFGEKEFVRISFATDDETVKAGCKLIVEFIQEEFG